MPGSGKVFQARLSRRIRSPLLALPGKQWAHEGPVVTEYAPAFISYPIGRGELGIRAEQGTVLLVCGKAGETE